MRELLEPLDPSATDIRAEQLARWQAGERVLVEALLRAHPGLARNEEALLDLIYSEVLLREEHGERPQPEEYLRRFPDLEAPLRRQLELHQALAALETGNVPEALSPTEGAGDGAATAATTEVGGDRTVHPTGPMPVEIGNYDLLEEVGRGGIGVVYKGRHRLLTNRIAAIKVLRTGENDSEALARFQLEARAVADLRHPNIVPIYELGTHRSGGVDVPFVALEYVDGGSLARKINGTPLPPREAAELLLPLAEGVAHAHARGIIHRDLKPANVLLASGVSNDPGRASPGSLLTPLAIPKITDFGLAKRLDADSGQTRTGAIMGTPSYMAPEQAAGQNDRIGPAADVWALGAILYDMLTGRPPFRADTILNTLAQVVKLEPVPPCSLQASVPRDLETICLKCLRKEPEKRYASAEALAADLNRYLHGEPIQARPVSLVERAMKWVRRHPAAAGLLSVSGLALAGLVALWVFFTVQLREEKQHVEDQRRVAVNERDEAERQKQLARANELTAKRERDEARKQTERAGRILKLAAASIESTAKNVRGAKQVEITTGNTGSILFQLARSYADAASKLNADKELLLEDRTALAEQYAASAVFLLGCARAVGFFDRSKPENRSALETSAELKLLSGRDDYKEFVTRLR